MALPNVKNNVFFPVKANFKLIPLLILLRGFHKRNSLFLFSSFPRSFAPPFSLDFHLCLSVSLATLSMKILSNLTKRSLWNVQKEEYLQICLLQTANCTEYTVYPLSHSFILSLIHYQANGHHLYETFFDRASHVVVATLFSVLLKHVWNPMMCFFFLSLFPI